MANDTDLTFLYNLSPSIQSKLCTFLRVAQTEWSDRIGNEFKLEKQRRELAERKINQLETQIQESNHKVKHYEERIRSLETELKIYSQYYQQVEQYQANLMQEMDKLKQQEKSVALIEKQLEYKEKQLDEREHQLKLRENELLHKKKKDSSILVSERHSCFSKGRERDERESEQKQKRHQQYEENRMPQLQSPFHSQSIVSSMNDSIHKRKETANEQSLNTHQSRLTSPETVSIRQRSSSLDRKRPSMNRKVYGEITPGAVTHEDIQRRFSEYFTKYRRQSGSVLISPGASQRKTTLSCYILQTAYNTCKDHILKMVGHTLVKDGTEEAANVSRARELLQKCSTSNTLSSLTANQGVKGELNILFSSPREVTALDNVPVNWEERKYAFTLLLNSTIIETDRVTKILTDTILQKTIFGNKTSTIIQMTTEAVNLAWDMVTLVPPALVCQPSQYHEEWHEKRVTYWKEESLHHLLIYFRPVLLFSALGHVGYKGEVGNVSERAEDMRRGDEMPTPSNSAKPKYAVPPLPLHVIGSRTKKSPCQNSELSKSFGILPQVPSQKPCSRCCHVCINYRVIDGQVLCQNCSQ